MQSFVSMVACFGGIALSGTPSARCSNTCCEAPPGIALLSIAGLGEVKAHQGALLMTAPSGGGEQAASLTVAAGSVASSADVTAFRHIWM